MKSAWYQFIYGLADARKKQAFLDEVTGHQRFLLFLDDNLGHELFVLIAFIEKNGGFRDKKYVFHIITDMETELVMEEILDKSPSLRRYVQFVSRGDLCRYDGQKYDVIYFGHNVAVYNSDFETLKKYGQFGPKVKLIANHVICAHKNSMIICLKLSNF